MESATTQGIPAGDSRLSFLLDTDICSAYLKNDPRVLPRFMLHFGGLHMSAITVGELFVWAKRTAAPPAREASVRDLIRSSAIIEVHNHVAERYGETRAELLDAGLVVGESDVFIAATALVHNLTLVTHNTADYQNIPNLQLVDWLLP
jgi:predicted nucleic acid-binding protein